MFRLINCFGLSGLVSKQRRYLTLIVKADDIGVHLIQDKYNAATQKLGRGIVNLCRTS